MGDLFQQARILIYLKPLIKSLLAGLGIFILSSCGLEVLSEPKQINGQPTDLVKINYKNIQNINIQQDNSLDTRSPIDKVELENCLFIQPCTIAQLPPIGLITNNITMTTEHIMERLWTAESWMEERFREFLQIMPAEYLYLFRPITGIAIADDIGNSHYWAATGGIYINPSFLWLSQEEKESINFYEDKRKQRINKLNFRVKWQYRSDNITNELFSSETLKDIERDWQQTFITFAAMLTHELAHANDYLPSHALEMIDYQETFADSVYYGTHSDIPMLRVSKSLHDKYPIANRLTKISRAYYGGIDIDNYRNWQAEDLGFSFQYDGASSLYSYYSKEEDLAMLFEEVMMKGFFNLDRELAFTDRGESKLEYGTENCKFYKIQWGQKNRFASPNVRQRAQYIVSQILPEYDFKDLFNRVLSSSPLTNIHSWCSPIDNKNIKTTYSSSINIKWKIDESHHEDHDLQGFHKNIMKDLANPTTGTAGLNSHTH